MRNRIVILEYIALLPNDRSFYVAEVVDDSNKIPDKTVLCLLRNYGGKELMKDNGDL